MIAEFAEFSHTKIFVYKLVYIQAFSAKKERTRDAASPFSVSSSGGRIRTSDLRVMSVKHSKTVSCWQCRYLR